MTWFGWDSFSSNKIVAGFDSAGTCLVGSISWANVVLAKTNKHTSDSTFFMRCSNGTIGTKFR